MRLHLADISNSAKGRVAEAAVNAARELETMAEGLLSKAAQAGSGMLHGVKSRLDDISEAGKNGLADAEQAIDSRIVHRPVTSVLAALVSGLMLGILMTTVGMRRSSRQDASKHRLAANNNGRRTGRIHLNGRARKLQNRTPTKKAVTR